MLTWPYVTRLRDAVVDVGDPYLVSWILWWGYHQMFTDPLNLFHSNLFYPLRYTLAFSEHSYGIALLFFPLFALGAHPLTVHSVALCFGFAPAVYLGSHLLKETREEVVEWDYGRAHLPRDLEPGETAHLELKVRAPETTGKYVPRATARDFERSIRDCRLTE